jgi:hypothetical protein
MQNFREAYIRTKALSMGKYIKLVNAYRLDLALRAETNP